MNFKQKEDKIELVREYTRGRFSGSVTPSITHVNVHKEHKEEVIKLAREHTRGRFAGSVTPSNTYMK